MNLPKMVDQFILDIKPIAAEDFNLANQPATKDDLQQFKRFNYKSFQTIQESLDAQSVIEDTQTKIGEIEAESIETQFMMAKQAVELFNVFDRARMTLQDSGNFEISKQMLEVVNYSVAVLSKMGIDEIDVYGKEFNGEFMESIGTISANETDEDIDIYHVAQVFKKAFKFQKNGKIIQDAVVKTVL